MYVGTSHPAAGFQKKMEQPFEKKYPMRRALIQKRGRYPVPPRSRFLMEGPDFFLKKRGPASRRASWIQAMIFAETA